jgi:2-keto-3-deoxy-L-rhamnonate aldolase RhmA
VNIKDFKRDGKAVGTMLKIMRDPATVLIAAQAGLDFVMLDMEHATYGFDDISYMAAAAGSTGVKIMARVPELSKGYVSRALDSGATGVMVPMIQTKEEAEMLAAWAKYPFVGSRGLSARGAHTGYERQKDIKHFMARENEATLCIAQIETGRAVENIDDIARVEGIDALLIGPNDLALSLGCPGEFMASVVMDAIERVAAAAAENDKIFGMHADRHLISKWLPYGLRLIMSSTDVDLLFKGMETLAKEESFGLS